MHDLIETESRKFNHITAVFRECGTKYGFDEIHTPVLESSELFLRTLGGQSDVVSKEMFTFNIDDDSYTLRPEGTAGAMRALINSGQLHQLPQRWMYVGPMFRHERPQKGRYRQV
jgi:histidyl-tRNA synthetase